ncbi:MAG: S8 family serine peptidase [Kiritimatiellae bacterium]|nr:S8 family serine peptidase [Kiritimatiellia bacterium]
MSILAGALLAALLPLVSLAGSLEAGSCIRLRNAVIDTSAVAQQARNGVLNAQNKIAADSASMPGQFGDADRRLPFIVQFTGPVQQAWKQAVERTGARLGGYLPDNAFIVELTSSQLGQVAALECVQWVGPFKPEYKTDPTLGQRVAAALNTVGPVAIADETFTIQTFSSATVSVVRDAVLGRNGQVLSISSSGKRGLLRVRMSVAGVSALLSLPEVEFIEVYVAPKLHNNIGTDSEHMNVQSLWTNYTLTGAGQVVCVADTGLDTGNTNTIHPDFSNRVVAAFALGRPNNWSDSATTGDPGGHGTHVAGSVLGSGAAYSNGLFRGSAYEALLVFQSIMDSGGKLGGIPDELTNLFWQAYTSGARIHTDSWGAAINGQYNANSQSADQFMWDIRDMLVLFSAGNSGVDANSNGVISATSMGAPGTAKNVLTVGAAESKRPSGSGGYSAATWGENWPTDYPANPIRDDLISTAFDAVHQGMAAFSSRGPCVDGRTKPDIVAPGTDIISCRSRMPGASLGWGTGSGILGDVSSNYYTFNGGTSMSTPLTAGAAALVRQYLQTYRGFADPSAALMKAIMVNGARSLSPGQYGVGPYREIPGGARPNNVEGWGQVDLASTLFPSTSYTNIYYDMTNSVDAMVTGGGKTFSFVSSGTNRISITLCWSDYPASLPAASQLVNDLDLTVTMPDGVVHYPNGLAGADRLNNVEGVDLPSVTLGTIRIRVSGYNVPNGPQRYALVIHAAGAVTSTVAVAGDFDSDGRADPSAYQNGELRIAFSGNSYHLFGVVMGGPGEIECSADFDGDGKTDPAVYNSTVGILSVLFSAQSYELGGMTNMGGVGCVPVIGDFDGDRKSDPSVYSATAGQLITWLSSWNYSDPRGIPLGGSGWLNASADFDGDGTTDPAVFEPATGRWQMLLSRYSFALFGWVTTGGAGAVPVAGDYDRDGKADLMIYQPAGGVWLCTYSGQNYTTVGGITGFGGPTMVARTGDYDNDGKADLAVYDPVTRSFYIMLSGSDNRQVGMYL